MSETNHKSDQDLHGPVSPQARNYTALQWREQPPQTSGYFYVREKLPRVDLNETIRIVFVHDHPDFGLMKEADYRIGEKPISVLIGDVQWAGPIPVPLEPEAKSAV